MPFDDGARDGQAQTHAAGLGAGHGLEQTVALIVGDWLCLALFQALPQLDPVWRALLITGSLGALTTFSTFSAEVVGLLQQQRLAQALGLCALHVAGSLCMTWAGLHSLPWLWTGARQGV